ncbi:MAG: sigma-70 family RNA polymerase sigma factor [Planctomycetota bacterium]|nr:MAG: sigma-70 family RNA polymerase sigma factor [Planctomycetota bacterium]REJ88677.1 MAG: sigma-70 family RNA polymerase sigma factor [Planctomycetota bacterium]REK20716.1 MAG: sigma-70 family RNA polymerase sigma factor [Planctomycetota bacterium]REK38102.1 MAG: sigma-70 family RNA polymerase sigma factor [Planctomycetota bacterium]
MALTEIDRRLLKQCLARTPGAWQDLVDRFLGLFVHVIQHTAHARSVRLSADDIDDLCSEIFVTLLKNDFAVLRNFRGQSSLATYLTVVARRIVVHQLVRRAREEALGHISAHQAAVDAAGRETREPQRIEDAEEISLLMNRIPPADAQIVRMFHLEGKSYHEISDKLGIPENTVGSTLSRAREKLRVVRVPDNKG